MDKLLVFLAYVALTLLLTPIRAFGNVGVKVSSLLGFLLFSILTVVLIKRRDVKVSAPWVLLMGLLGISLINLPFHVIHFHETLGTLIEYIVHLLAVVAGYYYAMIKKTDCKIVFCIFCMAIVTVLSLYVYDLIWTKWMLN
ncbi:MAG TPA: hypothetical protein GXX64_04830 [Bacteroidales bacterium]|jgi:hypothetical protein|nr:hypothetical protein [Bacteroidales bacterium]